MARRAKFGQPPPYVDHHSAKQIAGSENDWMNMSSKGKTTSKQKLEMKNEVLPLNYMQEAQGNYFAHA
jgi:hypothetical protein